MNRRLLDYFTQRLAEEMKENGGAGQPGPAGPQGEPGKDGEDGYTPRRGVDYWTEDDQKAILREVTDLLIVNTNARIENGVLVVSYGGKS